MDSILEHAKVELELIKMTPSTTTEEINLEMYNCIMNLLKVFSDQGHSGFSASYCINTFKQLAMFELLSPLTGKDDEWIEVGNNTYQNKRCSHVFKDETGAYDIDGRFFVGKDGSCFTSHESKVFIEFPYTPRSEYVEVDK